MSKLLILSLLLSLLLGMYWFQSKIQDTPIQEVKKAPKIIPKKIIESEESNKSTNTKLFDSDKNSSNKSFTEISDDEESKQSFISMNSN